MRIAKSDSTEQRFRSLANLYYLLDAILWTDVLLVFYQTSYSRLQFSAVGVFLFRMTDHFNLERFVRAQDPVIEDVRSELRAGRKDSHWMWFIFPQVRGLGSSPTAEKYAIGSREEAEAYLAHPVLGPRLRECTELMNAVQDKSIGQILGYPDDLKFRSSMTLFSIVANDNGVFRKALDKYFNGEPDPLTTTRL